MNMTPKQPPRIKQWSAAASPKLRLAIFVGVVAIAMAAFLSSSSSSSSSRTTLVEFARTVVLSSFLAAMIPSSQLPGDDTIGTHASTDLSSSSSSSSSSVVVAETAGGGGGGAPEEHSSSSSSPPSRPHRGKVIGSNVKAADVRGSSISRRRSPPLSLLGTWKFSSAPSLIVHTSLRAHSTEQNYTYE